MQSAEAVLDVLRERGRRGLPCDELYRQLFNPNLYLLAYGRIYANHGAMTPGACGETADGMSEAKIGRITEAMRHERYRFRPVRRVHIPKSNGKTRPLGLPSWSDKLVGEVIRLLLEAYYEPRFSGRSHGFRPGRGCHTALSEVAHKWTGTTWFIEGDISDCFGSLDHEVLLAILSEKIRDNRFLRLIQQMLKAGYVEDWKWHATLSGSPQGGVLSPLLSNIYMDRLDTFVETVLIPEYTRGTSRRKNPEYQKLENAIWNTRQRLAKRKEHTESAQVRQWRKELRRHPVGDPHDPDYRRLRYIRYADDHLLGFTGPKAEAETIKQRLAAFLRDDLKLELNQSKTLITHGRTQAARFLGYDITVQHADAKVSRGGRVNRGMRSINGKVSLRVPKDVIKAKCAPFVKHGKPAHLDPLTGCTPFDIISLYGAQYRGIVQYYLLAGDVWKLDRLKGVMLTSLLKTLAAKHRSRVTTMANRYKTTIKTPQGPRRCFEARIEREGRKPLVARFGGIPLTRKRTAVLDDLPSTMFTPRSRPRGSQLIDRLQRGRCELCERRTEVQVHQIRSLAELHGREERPAWALLMLKKRRRTLVVCPPCHGGIHA
ncbi:MULTISPECIES: reverse transcriptase/maturase family protein [Streptomyces]|uniref:Reverse transcriptase domain-containing protein n=2 Tax=Streptomyces celluloflavus TaxID=58344 RepID=A0ABW7R7S9_9ACTN|nr:MULTISPECIES: reverse transcriptase/maturase family protein [Streptomyces]WSK12995.1 reverse transcriptase domain-containing protein [Streptomyces celluloflavus]WSK13082.1 reverse transcriptase domain-containing protein [Streptomyces celluloflavus]WSK15701.1 reverse transcriptase domain-containing protein [Streptomyces celluloflavus]